MSQFGGGQQDYGYFTPSRSAGAASNQFGSAPVGAPTATRAGGFGAPVPASLSDSAARRSPALKLIVAALVLAALVVGGWFGWIAYQTSRPLVVPGTLSAMSPVTLPKVKTVKAEVEAAWQQQYPGKPLAIEVYSGHDQAIILAMTRGRSDVEKDFADAGINGAVQPVGKARCAAMSNGLVACERSSRTLSAMVLVFGGSAQEAAAALDEAWQLQ